MLAVFGLNCSTIFLIEKLQKIVLRFFVNTERRLTHSIKNAFQCQRWRSFTDFELIPVLKEELFMCVLQSALSQGPAAPG